MIPARFSSVKDITSFSGQQTAAYVFWIGLRVLPEIFGESTISPVIFSEESLSPNTLGMQKVQLVSIWTEIFFVAN